MENTDQKLKSLYTRSSEDVKSMLIDDDFGPVITSVCKNAGIDADTALDVEDIVTNFLLGTVPPNELLSQLISLNIPKEAALELAKELAENIFTEVEDSLKTTYHIKGGLGEEILGKSSSKPPEKHSLADDLLGSSKKEEVGSVLIRPEGAVRDNAPRKITPKTAPQKTRAEEVKKDLSPIEMAREALSKPTIDSGSESETDTPPIPNKSSGSTPPQNLPGATRQAPETTGVHIPETITPASTTSGAPTSAYPVPPVPDNAKTGPSEDTSGVAPEIPENIFEAKLRKVTESLGDSPASNKQSSVPSDPYREPIE